MTLNGLVAIILHYFAEFGSFHGQLRESGWLAINRFSPKKCHKLIKHDGCAVLFAVAEFLVKQTGLINNDCSDLMFSFQSFVGLRHVWHMHLAVLVSFFIQRLQTFFYCCHVFSF